MHMPGELKQNVYHVMTIMITVVIIIITIIIIIIIIYNVKEEAAICYIIDS